MGMGGGQHGYIAGAMHATYVKEVMAEKLDESEPSLASPYPHPEPPTLESHVSIILYTHRRIERILAAPKVGDLPLRASALRAPHPSSAPGSWVPEIDPPGKSSEKCIPTKRGGLGEGRGGRQPSPSLVDPTRYPLGSSSTHEDSQYWLSSADDCSGRICGRVAKYRWASEIARKNHRRTCVYASLVRRSRRNLALGIPTHAALRL
ncbi:hypothetical protein GGS23DRAFT_573705 [Durotheca rogersii]|uniref:uncharacterized protein n=1 Tax=Durotheca rogersii TaxID=419775 RepID=UPI00222121D3|nr:uncharacterized protein GGS23DRAFT_573705 [Durotheca rogersii]KAI5861899.1 hypothetical protein GGS23DRAFT_573705 [Durotheca rogersii]